MKFKRPILCMFLMAFMLAGFVAPVAAAKPMKNDEYAGNGSPSGAHYNLNIIGHPGSDLNENFNGGEGKRIFVERTGTTSIYVDAGTQFDIIDCNGMDSDGARIELPYDSGVWKVTVYVRLLGPPTSELKWKSYYLEGALWMEFGAFELDAERAHGENKFQAKTGSLLKDGYEHILWELYDKQDFRILQMRFYVEEA